VLKFSLVLNSKTVLKIQHRCNDSNPQNAYQLSSYAVHSNVPLDKFYSEPTTTLLCENFNNGVATPTKQKYENFNNEVTKPTEHLCEKNSKLTLKHPLKISVGKYNT